MPYRDEAVLKPLSKTIAELLKSCRVSKDATLKGWYGSLLRHACRELEDFIRPRVSEAASNKAGEMMLSPIEQVHWDDQSRKMEDEGRAIFHWDHVVPVACVVKRLADLDPIALGDSELVLKVEMILKDAEIAWILKEENRRLDDAGFRDRNRCDLASALAAYEKCKIKLL